MGAKKWELTRKRRWKIEIDERSKNEKNIMQQKP